VRFRLIAVLLALALPARANLGDTIDQCIKRYGRPVGYSEASGKIPFGTLVFVAGGYTLIIFLNGTTEVGARVSKTNKSAFTDEEMKTIMDSDMSTPWKVTPTKQPDTLAWQRDDGATSFYDSKARMLIFTSHAMAEAMKRAATSGPTTNAPAAGTNAASPGTNAGGQYIPPGATFAPAPAASFPPLNAPTNAAPTNAAAGG
jgi:hypothetical protein